MRYKIILNTAYNSVFAVRFANPNAFGTSQTRKTLAEILLGGIPNGERIINFIIMPTLC